MTRTLAEYLTIDYPLRLIPDPYGGYVFEYPDLPGCVGQIDSLHDLAEHAEEARCLWLETAYERGIPIPTPSAQDDYSGRFVVRLSKSLHQRLSRSAAAEGVSLNFYVGITLAEAQGQQELSKKIDALCVKVDSLRDHLSVSYSGFHQTIPHKNSNLVDDLALAA